MWEGRYSVVVEEKKLSSAAVQFCNKRRIALCFEGWRVFMEQRRESHILKGGKVQLCINGSYMYVYYYYCIIKFIRYNLLMLSKILIVHGDILYLFYIIVIYNC